MKIERNTSRDRRAVGLLIIAVLLTIVHVKYSANSDIPAVVAPAKAATIPDAEALLAKMRESVARVPGKDQLLRQAAGELAQREKGLIVADTANQAQERVLQIIRRVAQAQVPPVEIRGVDLGQPRAFGDGYGQVTIAAVFECRMDQLVNLLADLSARPELVAIDEMRLNAANPKQKTVTVRLAVSGIVPKRLVPTRKDTF